MLWQPSPHRQVVQERLSLCCQKASLSNLVRDLPKGFEGTMPSLQQAAVSLKLTIEEEEEKKLLKRQH